MSIMWEHETELTDLDIDVPRWIDQDIDSATVAAIVQGGCASGAYMPAVTYHQALETMSEHGDAVLDYLEERYGYIPSPDAGTSWAGMACFYLSAAVEAWAASVEDDVEDALRNREAEAAEEGE